MASQLMQKVDNEKLCLGCGFCEAVYGKENCSMKIGADGFFHPYFTSIDDSKEEILARICPSLNVVHEGKLSKEERIWGRIVGLYEAYSTDQEIRKMSSSGGVITGLAVFVLDSKVADGILHVGGDPKDYFNNKLKISKNRSEILSNSSSRYAPALVFNDLFDILNETSDIYCFIGKPCDVAALRNFLQVFPQYKDRFSLTISIFCAGIPSFRGTEQLIEEFLPVRPVSQVVYRGEGWPGLFSFRDAEGKRFSKTYNESWGKVLNRNLSFRCKICPEGIGMLADIAVGDAWETVDGYPNFSEKDGYSVAVTRTEPGERLMQSALKAGYLKGKPINKDRLAIMQPFQYKRRKYVAARLLAAILVKGIRFNFVELALTRNVFSSSLKTALREFQGTFRRALSA
jgi:coenzyme F420 hydrogenase subunit beta